MTAPRRRLLSLGKAAARQHHAGNLVGADTIRVGAGGAVAVALCASILAGCGARSSLDEGERPEARSAASCVPPPATPFTHSFGDEHVQVASSIAIDRHGYPLIAGAFSGTLNLGVGTLHAPIPPPVLDTALPAVTQISLGGSFFLARLATDGCAPFALAFSPLDQVAESIDVALDGDDAILLSATYYGLVDFGGGPLGAANSNPAAAIAKFSPTGAHHWSRAVLADQITLARPSSDGHGNVFLAGIFVGALRIGDVAIATSTDHLIDGFVAMLDPSGTLVWSRILRLSSYQKFATPISVAAWPEGDVAVAGQFVHESSEPLDLGSGPMGSSESQSGYVASFDAFGQHRWDKLVDPLVTDAAVAPSSGDLVVLGVWDGNGFPLQRFDRSGTPSALVITAAPVGTPSLAVSADGEALIASALPPAAGKCGIFTTAVAASGETLWTKMVNPPDGLQSYRVAAAFGPEGTPLLAGGFTGTMDLGTGAVAAEAGQPDIFVARVAP